MNRKNRKNGFTLVEGAAQLDMPQTKAKFAFTLTEGATHVAMPPTKMNFAFTLAEILITLGVIGIVAAMTIPGLINNYRARQLRSKFLKSYSTIQQVYKQMQTDDISLDPSTYQTSQYYKIFINYLQGATDCGLGNNENKICLYTRATGNPNYRTYKTFSGRTAYSDYFDDGQIALPDGTLLLFENYTNVGYIFISVDINGVENLPNQWGYDLFTFQLIDDEIKPMGQKGTTFAGGVYCSETSTSSINGIACAAKAKDDSEYFKKIVKKKRQ